MKVSDIMQVENSASTKSLGGVQMKKMPVFKPYEQHQVRMLPINLDEMIPANHMVRVVDKAIDRMDLKPLFDRYPGGGTSAYNPTMMLKVVMYAYADKSTHAGRSQRRHVRTSIFCG
jgi:transposase